MPLYESVSAYVMTQKAHSLNALSNNVSGTIALKPVQSLMLIVNLQGDCEGRI